ncbi:MAG: hypothetical protein AUG51_09425 [Acidobacteria bacterium 13_1_20CM_3_53_8]|nr:MAG: hypothetical protein AUG51_09425 [Acidobacteria bacterium 13_1_20CM_3_53_8]
MGISSAKSTPTAIVEAQPLRSTITVWANLWKKRPHCGQDSALAEQGLLQSGHGARGLLVVTVGFSSLSGVMRRFILFIP